MPFLSPLAASLPARAASRPKAGPRRDGVGESFAPRALRREATSTKMRMPLPLLALSASPSRPLSSSASASFSSSSSSSSSPSPPPPPPPPPQNKTTKEPRKTTKEQRKTTKEQRQRRNPQPPKQQQKQSKAPPRAFPPLPLPRLSTLFRPSPQRQLERQRRQVNGVPPLEGSTG